MIKKEKLHTVSNGELAKQQEDDEIHETPARTRLQQMKQFVVCLTCQGIISNCLINPMGGRL